METMLKLYVDDMSAREDLLWFVRHVNVSSQEVKYKRYFGDSEGVGELVESLRASRCSRTAMSVCNNLSPSARTALRIVSKRANAWVPRISGALRRRLREGQEVLRVRDGGWEDLLAFEQAVVADNYAVPESDIVRIQFKNLRGG
jgi:hypothetical protein